MPSSSNQATHNCTVRRFTSAKSEAILVEWPLRTPKTAIILLRIRISLSACMASVSSRIFLLFSSMGGSTIRRSLSFSVTLVRKAKFSMGVTLVVCAVGKVWSSALPQSYRNPAAAQRLGRMRTYRGACAQEQIAEPALFRTILGIVASWSENCKPAQQSLSEPISNFVSAVYIMSFFLESLSDSSHAFWPAVVRIKHHAYLFTRRRGILGSASWMLPVLDSGLDVLVHNLWTCRCVTCIFFATVPTFLPFFISRMIYRMDLSVSFGDNVSLNLCSLKYSNQVRLMRHDSRIIEQTKLNKAFITNNY